jgi:hypothetical protein
MQNLPVFTCGKTVLTLGEPWRGSGYRPLVEIKKQPNMRSKWLSSGEVAYYWEPPWNAKREGIPVFCEPLGTNFVEAVRRATKLNALCGAFPKSKRKSMAIPAVLPFRQEFRAAA